jgi:hypothetical protein
MHTSYCIHKWVIKSLSQESYKSILAIKPTQRTISFNLVAQDLKAKNVFLIVYGKKLE